MRKKISVSDAKEQKPQRPAVIDIPAIDCVFSKRDVSKITLAPKAIENSARILPS
jgi:hypothetical protein